MNGIIETREDSTCADCGRLVVSHAMTGHEPKICGRCARERMVCPWCGEPARKVALGYHCAKDDDYYGIGSANDSDDGVIY
jgi:hypothetical protein